MSRAFPSYTQYVETVRMVPGSFAVSSRSAHGPGGKAARRVWNSTHGNQPGRFADHASRTKNPDRKRWGEFDGVSSSSQQSVVSGQWSVNTKSKGLWYDKSAKRSQI